MRLILYGKPGCHLCEGLQEKLEQVQNIDFELEVRDITTREDWFEAFQYEIPVLFRVRVERKTIEEPLPRPSPRATVRQLEQMLQKYLVNNDSE
ncbi:glutaredoxin family protein [Argonema antarcticum]|uniref:glutaredoxin family protein n=1 Tax=Argonema antarcticum TaxID=2942763 RepID=UPI0020118858|nr:glutaredoxin family protein [Argonema antarcticum]MCL1471843.1 glutaredoxin family protein [Argonema antarcticum A004/B2]